MDKSDIFKLSLVPLALVAIAVFMYFRVPSLALDHLSDKPTMNRYEKLAGEIEDGSIGMDKAKLVQLLKIAAEGASAIESAYGHLLAALKSLSFLMVFLGILHFILLFTIWRKRLNLIVDAAESELHM